MQEQFIYSLMASGLGILIVFLILTLLCGLMILIRKLSDTDQTQSQVQKPSIPAQAATPAIKHATTPPSIPLPVLVAAATAGTASGSIEWLGAAVAAYLATDEIDGGSAWSSDINSKYDPWVANNKLSKTVPGV
ncbi:MAG: hypothetical protein PQJ46_06315 [Spirochaetales bacterium]|nr:hypothetical protein [Spirochaetales bacterium]